MALNQLLGKAWQIYYSICILTEKHNNSILTKHSDVLQGSALYDGKVRPQVGFYPWGLAIFYLNHGYIIYFGFVNGFCVFFFGAYGSAWLRAAMLFFT